MGNVQLSMTAKDCFLELNNLFSLEISSCHRAVPPTGLSSPKSKKALEEISEVRKNIFDAGKPLEPSTGETIMTVLVVDRALLRISKNLIRFGGFLKLLFGGFVSWIEIGMVLFRLLAIRLFDLSLRSAFGDA